jgi:hypothetical protein
MKRLALAVVLSFVAATAFAQDAGEFGRFYEGTLEMAAKHAPGAGLSGSLSMTAGKSDLPFGSSGKRYDATFGGTLVKDRAWFFASGERSSMPTYSTNINGTPIALDPSLRLGMNAAVSNTQSLDASFSSGTLPKSFLSLHYTGMISSNSFFTANVSQTK